MTILIILGFIIVFSAFLLLFQRRMIYFPHKYEANYKTNLPENIVELSYQTPQGRQIAFFIPPKIRLDISAMNLWVLFHGNASVALDWLQLIMKVQNEKTGFLLIDYPGYGKCEGKPSAKNISISCEYAFEILAKHLKVEKSSLENNLNILGYSIGAGVGLQFAVQHQVKCIILISPFTSLLDMARRSVGIPLCYLLRESYDNRARLDELAKLDNSPVVHIFHGDADDIVPFYMGQELANHHPQMIIFHPIKNADHLTILDIIGEQILKIVNK